MGENGYIDFCLLLLLLLLIVRSTYAHVNPLNGELCPRVLGVCTGPHDGQAGTGTGTGEIDLTCVHDSARGRAVQSVCQIRSGKGEEGIFKSGIRDLVRGFLGEAIMRLSLERRCRGWWRLAAVSLGCVCRLVRFLSCPIRSILRSVCG